MSTNVATSLIHFFFVCVFVSRSSNSSGSSSWQRDRLFTRSSWNKQRWRFASKGSSRASQDTQRSIQVTIQTPSRAHYQITLSAFRAQIKTVKCIQCHLGFDQTACNSDLCLKSDLYNILHYFLQVIGSNLLPSHGVEFMSVQWLLVCVDRRFVMQVAAWILLSHCGALPSVWIFVFCQIYFFWPEHLNWNASRNPTWIAFQTTSSRSGHNLDVPENGLAGRWSSLVIICFYSFRSGHAKPDDAWRRKFPSDGPSTPWSPQWHVWVFLAFSKCCFCPILSLMTPTTPVSDPSSQPDGTAPAQLGPPASGHSWSDQEDKKKTSPPSAIT